MRNKEMLENISALLQKGKTQKLKECISEALNSGIPAEEILNKGLLSGMNVIGEKFKNNEVFIPEVMMAAKAMSAGVELLKPFFKAYDACNKGTVVIGTVQGDMHDIGKNLVKIMMEGKGLNVIDLGSNVPCEAFIAKAKESNAKVIALSALLTTTMPEMKKLVAKLNEEGLHSKIKVMIGGAPVSSAFCSEIGADCYASDAASAADAALALCAD